jgi:hypothetical protein
MNDDNTSTNDIQPKRVEGLLQSTYNFSKFHEFNNTLGNWADDEEDEYDDNEQEIGVHRQHSKSLNSQDM